MLATGVWSGAAHPAPRLARALPSPLGTTPVDRPGAGRGGHGGLSARPPLPPRDRPQEVAEPALTASRPLRTTRTGRTTSTLKGTSPSAGAGRHQLRRALDAAN